MLLLFGNIQFTSKLVWNSKFLKDLKYNVYGMVTPRKLYFIFKGILEYQKNVCDNVKISRIVALYEKFKKKEVTDLIKIHHKKSLWGMDRMSKANLRHFKGNLDLITAPYVLGTSDYR